MDVAFVVFDDMTALDFVGAFDPVTRLSTMGYADVEWSICGRTGAATATAGLRVDVDETPDSLAAFDLVVVPGGAGARRLEDDDAFVEWVATAAGADVVASVCTGALLLGAAGLLAGRRATTHPRAYDRLADYCTVVDDRVVDEGDVVTARGVSSSLDLGLHLVERFADPTVRAEIAARMDYPDAATD